MDPILLDLGFLVIYKYSLMIFLAALIGGSIILLESKRFKISEDYMLNLFFFLLPLAVIGARLYYVAFNWDYYSQNIVSIFKIWEGGLAIHGALIAGLIWIIIMTKKYKISTLLMLDMTVVGLIIGQAIGRWGNFFNGEAHGVVTSLEALQKMNLPQFIIDGMYINGSYYEPTFLYESIWCLIGFIILLIIKAIKKNRIGQLSSVYLIWYGIGRFIIEGMRTDSLMLGDMRMAQLISIGMIVLGVVFFVISLRQRKYHDTTIDYSDVKY